MNAVLHRILFHVSQSTYLAINIAKQVFYLEVPGKAGWSYVVRYYPRGRPVKYNHVDDEDNHEE